MNQDVPWVPVLLSFPMVTELACGERLRLVKCYATATHALALSVAVLREVRDWEGSKFEAAWRACEVARADCQALTSEIYRHIGEHQCSLRIPNGRSPRQSAQRTRSQRRA